MSDIAFVHAGDRGARRVWQAEGRGDWSAALPLVLEKHGFLGVDSIAAEDIRSLQQLEGYSCVLVARMHADDWSAALIEWVSGRGATAIVEGPLPPALREALGIHVIGTDARNGVVQVGDPTIRALAQRYGFTGDTRVLETESRAVARTPEMDWTALPAVPLTNDQATGWRVPAWDVERWALPDGAHVLATWLPDHDRSRSCPAVVQLGSLVLCPVQLFAYLGQGHTSEPWDGPEYRSSARRTPLECLLLGLIDSMHVRRGRVRARILPWPRGADWVRTVRHDFDRALPPSRVAEVLGLHDREGSAATWYWRARHLAASGGSLTERVRRRPSGGRQSIRLVGDHPRHEVALHTEMLWVSAERERRAIESVVKDRVVGASAHGDATCFRFQGAPNVLWAEREQLQYTELIQHGHMHPLRFAALEPDGVIRALSVVCLPHHESLDRSTADGDVNEQQLRDAASTWRNVGGMLQVMNHPDIHIPELFSILRDMPAGGRLDWTAGEAVDWWAKTHLSGAMRLTRTPDGSLEILAQGAVDDLVVELLHPDGTVTSSVQRLEAGVPSRVAAPQRPSQITT